MSGDIVGALRAALADRYRIERELGSGGMATVYLAASPPASPDSSHVNVASMASTASDHSWLDHSVHANALTMFG